METVQGEPARGGREPRLVAALAAQSRVLEMVATGRPLGETLEALAHAVEEQVPGAWASVLLLDAAGTGLRWAAAPRLPRGYVEGVAEVLCLAEGSCPCSAAASRREPVAVADVASGWPAGRYREVALASGVRGVLAAPVLARAGELLGTFALHFSRPLRPASWLRELAGLAGRTVAIAVGRSREEAALLERLELSEQLARIAGSVPGSVHSFELSRDGTARMPFTTQAAEDLFGLSRAELARDLSGWAARVHPEDAARVAATVAEAARGPTPWHDLYRYQHPVKGLRWIEGWSVPKAEPDGRIVWHGFVMDVTERKATEAALEEKERLLREVGALAHVGGWTLDPASGVVVWTDEVARIHDMEAAAEPDLAFALRFFEGESRRRIEAAVTGAAERGTPYDLELEMTTARGRRKWVRTIGVPVVREGRVVELHGMIQDITDRKRGEEVRERLREQLVHSQKMESVGRLAGGVAHDFNNMLSVIQGHTALALERLAPGDPLRDDLLQVQDAAHRSAGLTRQLLAFARRQPSVPRPIDLSETVTGMLGMLRRLIGEDVTLELRAGAGLWPVSIDPAQVDQLLANLCVNARDAIAGVGRISLETGNVSLDEAWCAAHPASRPGDFVVLAVRDDGCGMGRDVLDHLFEPFFTTKGIGHGTGLGLATVYGMVEQNGGFVTVESETGRGSTFRVHLPRHAGPLPAAEVREVSAPPAGSGETLLVVEDEPAILDLVRRSLERVGYRVLPAGKPADALRLAAEHRGTIDLLVSDLVMPEMNGLELAGRLELLRPGLRRLFVSGYSADVFAHRGIPDDGLSVLQKPFSLDELAVKVREVLGGAPRPGGPAPASRRILFVDDEVDLGFLTGRILEKHGHRVKVHSDPREALAELRRDPAAYDVVVSDIAMPGMTGDQLAREVRRVRPGLPVILTSGAVGPTQEATGRAAGAVAVVLKPATVGGLAAAIEELLPGG